MQGAAPIPPPAPPRSPVTLPATDSSSIVIVQDGAPKGLTDPALYAAGLPAVLVALFVLYASHLLTAQRERRKEVRELCKDLGDRADEAVDAAVRAWTETSKQKRSTTVMETYRRFKSVGVTATALKDLTTRKLWLRSLTRSRVNWKKDWEAGHILARDAVDVSAQVVNLKKTAMMDPFDDPARNASSRNLPAINDALGNLTAAVEREFHRIYR